MRSDAKSIEAYLASLAENRREAMSKLRTAIKGNLPEGFSEEMSYGMIGYVVPHQVYPAGYHCDPKLPLPFINIASQKNHIAFYHMGIYSDDELLHWFVDEYPRHVKTKLDMGKSCIRFRNIETIPYRLLGQLCTRITPKQWIATYESVIKKENKR